MFENNLVLVGGIMKNLLKRMLVFTIAFILIFSVVGCSENNNENFERIDFSNAVEIFEEDRVTVNISEAGECAVFKFVPNVTKKYYFFSLGSYNTRGFLYNENKVLVSSNDDSEIDENFFISHKLTQNKVYYLVVDLFDVLKVGMFKVEISSQYSQNQTNSQSNSKTEQTSISQGNSLSQSILKPGLNVPVLNFGSYPQAKVVNSSLITTLNSLTGNKPIASNSENWTVFEDYFISSNETEFMWFIDVEHLGEKYRGVYFNRYRPFWVADESTEDRSYQDDNGYFINTIYWFKFEPLTWHILATDSDKTLLVCENIIDCRQFDYSAVVTNHFEQSAIRIWLNDTFYNTAFSSLEKTKIINSTISNNERNSNPYENPTLWNGGLNPNAGANTNDNVFLLSMYETTNPNYGYSAYNAFDKMRKKAVTDYGKCQGSVIGENGYGYWWTRSPRSLINQHALVVYSDGGAYEGCSVYNTAFGVVPAIYISL